MEAVWPGTFVEEGVPSVNINVVRKALDESTGERQYIETVPRRGYRFVAAVREVAGEGAGPAGKQTRAWVTTEECPGRRD